MLRARIRKIKKNRSPVHRRHPIRVKVIQIQTLKEDIDPWVNTNQYLLTKHQADSTQTCGKPPGSMIEELLLHMQIEENEQRIHYLNELVRKQ